MFDFNNRVAMITGATGGLGRVVVSSFLQTGARLALIDRHEEELHQLFPSLAESPDCFMSSCADITDPKEVGSIVGAAVEKFGRIDILVNTVGGYRAGKPLHKTSLETWDFMLNLNVRSTFITSQCVIPHMIHQRGGKIIHFAARPGLNGRANAAAYSASKAAVIRLVESTAAELKEDGINVNCIIPGTIDTPQNRKALPNADSSRWVTPESLSDVIMFLSSDAARDIHGASIPVYGLT